MGRPRRQQKDHPESSGSPLTQHQLKNLARFCGTAHTIACPRPITTRGIGFIISRVTSKLRQQIPKQYFFMFGDAEQVPVAAIYRISLLQLQQKMNNINGPFFCRKDNSYDTHNFNLLPSSTNEYSFNLSQVALVINSIGYLKFNNNHFRPVFYKECSPLNLRIDNLRAYCEEMANPETESSKRVAGFELNSIPNAKWVRLNEDDPQSVILTNPDEIIPSGYLDLPSSEKLHEYVMCLKEFFYRWKANNWPEICGEIDFKCDGGPEMLVSTHVIPGQSLSLNDEIVSGNATEFWAFESIPPSSWYLGIFALTGEVMNDTNGTVRSNLEMSKMNERLGNAPRKLQRNPTLEKLQSLSMAVPIMEEPRSLSISTRGIGFMLSKMMPTLKRLSINYDSDGEVLRDIGLPIAAMYRASLIQLEVKMYFAGEKQSLPFSFRLPASDSTLFSSPNHFSNSLYDLAIDNCKNFTPIVILINSIGHIEVNKKHFEPRFLAERSPLNIRITNLREYCVEMSNLETESSKRVAGYKLNSIPNAEWKFGNDDDPQSVYLTNPDEIIPANYDENEMANDLCGLSNWIYVSMRNPGKDYYRFFPGSCGKIEYKCPGNPGILTSSHVVPGQSMRINDNEIVSQDLITKDIYFWSPECILSLSWSIGAITLAGEILDPTIASQRCKMLTAQEGYVNWISGVGCLYDY